MTQRQLVTNSSSKALKNTSRDYTYLTQEQRDYRRQLRRRERIFKKKCILFATLLSIAFCISISQFAIRSNAKTTSDRAYTTSYSSIMISNGDTLWSIAKEQTMHFPEVHIDDYVKTVKNINGLGSSDIKYGDYLIVPVFSYMEE